MSTTPLFSFDLEHPVKRALQEDIAHGDVTTNILVSSEGQTCAVLQAKQSLIVAGIPIIQKVFEVVDPSVSLLITHGDGETVTAGHVLATLHGNTRSILTGERVTLNFLQHLSGIATLTKQFCEAVQGYHTKILDTRKTTPGLRTLEKWAVTMGGGLNHRMSLNDGILIKDNHIAILKAQGIGLMHACRLARERGPHGLRMTVEIESLEEIEHALAGQADVLLLDNMTPALVFQAIRQIKGRAIIEVSGGITLTNVREYAAAGADYVSIGSLTQSAPAVDISLDIQSAQ